MQDKLNWLGRMALLTCLGAAVLLGSTTPAVAATTPAKVFHITAGPSANDEAQKAFFYASEGDTVEFGAGTFNFKSGLIIQGKRGLTIRGAGRDKTRLSFLRSNTAEGINASHCEGITIEDLEVIDTPGNGIRVFRSKYVTLRRIKAGWTDADPVKPGYQTKPTNGFYAIYPVMVQQLLVEDTYSYGSVDAGLYVGQSSDVIMRRNEARYNVIGIEMENVQRGLAEQNLATENTAGFLAYDLEGLSQYGEGSIVRYNRFVGNNVDNFGSAGFVKDAPRGTGAIIVAQDNVEFYGNELADNWAAGLLIMNYGFVNSKSTDLKQDWFNEAVNVHHNVFRNNGKKLQAFDPNNASTTLTAAILLKGFGISAHILTDGQVDKPNGCTKYPVDQNGIPLNQPNTVETWRVNPRLTTLGAPNFGINDPQPPCHFNGWKFRTVPNWLLGPQTKLKEEFRVCMSDNSFDAAVPPYLNLNMQNGELTNLRNFLLGDRNMGKLACKLKAVKEPTVNLPYVLPDNAVRQPSMEESARVCGAAARNKLNLDLAATYNCPTLDQYGLFQDEQDPRSKPMGTGMPFELTSTLFTNYASKYRFVFIPQGKQAQYRDTKTGFQTSKPAGVTDGPWYPAGDLSAQSLATLSFPTGTVIAKTFSFRREDASGTLINEDLIETRLLIKRTGANGPYWAGLPYVWEKDATSGKLVARLTPQGKELTGSYDYQDHDPDVKDANGQRARYKGEVKQYGVPSAMACVVCHGNERAGEAGAVPIGPKVKFLNRTNAALGNQNQLQYMKAAGLLSGLPESFAGVEKAPRWNVPGDVVGKPAGTPADVQARARAYLEANCASCHNPAGEASNSGLFLSSATPLNTQSGVCKKPVAAGRGAGGMLYDIVPGKPEESILLYRLASAENGVRMPTLGRVVAHAEGATFIRDWIKVMQPDENSGDVCK